MVKAPQRRLGVQFIDRTLSSMFKALGPIPVQPPPAAPHPHPAPPDPHLLNQTSIHQNHLRRETTEAETKWVIWPGWRQVGQGLSAAPAGPDFSLPAELSFVSSLVLGFYFIYFWEFSFDCVCSWVWVHVPRSQRYWTPWSWSYKQFCVSQCGCWEPDQSSEGARVLWVTGVNLEDGVWSWIKIITVW